MLRRSSAKALDPSRQLVDNGFGDGTVKVAGEQIDVEGTYALLLMCEKYAAPDPVDMMVLRWGYLGLSATAAELAGGDAREWSIRHAVLSRVAAGWLRERGMLRER